MKIKLFFLFLASIILTYLIYTTNTNEYLVVTSIYDDTTTPVINYNKYLKEKLDNTIYTTYYEYHNSNFEIENVTSNIKDNTNDIQVKLNSSSSIIIYLGNFEIEKEDTNTVSIYNDLEKLFILIRKYNHKQIIYLSPSKGYGSYLLKELCNKYNIVFINTLSLLNIKKQGNISLTEDNYKVIANRLYKEITGAWQIS